MSPTTFPAVQDFVAVKLSSGPVDPDSSPIHIAVSVLFVAQSYDVPILTVICVGSKQETQVTRRKRKKGRPTPSE